MRFTSLIVELVRARPRLIVWSVIWLFAAFWLAVPTLLYSSPPPQLATVLSIGREYQIGTAFGPPLAFWLADHAFWIVGGHMIGVWILTQISFVVTMGALFALARAMVGAQQAALAMLLTVTILPFSYPGLDFGPDVLARPLWALILLHSWQVLGEERQAAWFPLSIELGLLFLTTPAAILLILLLLVFALATERGQQTLLSLYPLFGALVVVVVALPYLTWLARSGALAPHLSFTDPFDKLKQWDNIALSLVFSILGIIALVVVNARWFDRKRDDAPVIFRPPVDRLAQLFVLFFGCVPPILFSILAPLLGLDHVAGGAGVALLLVGLVVIVMGGDLIALRNHELLRNIWLLAIAAPAVFAVGNIFVQPWLSGKEVATSLPAKAMGKQFDDLYRLRTGAPLPAVAGDPQLASLIGLRALSRPRVLLQSATVETPWFDLQNFRSSGGVVVWRASEATSAPPDDIAKQFPSLVVEVPRTFNRMITGKLAPLRVGWGVVLPPK